MFFSTDQIVRRSVGTLLCRVRALAGAFVLLPEVKKSPPCPDFLKAQVKGSVNS
jgi:hypothetical protein